MNVVDLGKKEIKAHAWERAGGDWYQEPKWCSSRLFEEEPFVGSIWDPACGGGNIVGSAARANYEVAFSDITNRNNSLNPNNIRDFFSIDEPCDNIVTNPPFNMVQAFYVHAMDLARGKVAMIFPVPRLNAAHWLERTPLTTIWLMTPRPSMPPGEAIAAGEKAGGGKVDFCWLVWSKYELFADKLIPPIVRWLYRDKARQRA